MAEDLTLPIRFELAGSNLLKSGKRYLLSRLRIGDMMALERNSADPHDIGVQDMRTGKWIGFVAAGADTINPDAWTVAKLARQNAHAQATGQVVLATVVAVGDALEFETVIAAEPTNG